ncbi:MAG TPA: TolC family protein [Terracidiphilus sp.]|nr:TolC family protein [Terracidiphilus sp.]
MKSVCCGLFALALLLAAAPAPAQSPESYRGMLTARDRSAKLPPPQHLANFVQNGKLRLSLRDAILLMLENNSAIRVDESQIEFRKFSLLGSFQPFDPILQSSLNINRYSSPGYSQLQGVGESNTSTLNTLTQTGQLTYSQTFSPGTSFQAAVSSSKSGTNSSFNYFNPYFNSTLNLQFTQPLLRGAGRFANTALILIARRSLDQSKANFSAEVNDALQQLIGQYWAAVQARGALDVQQRSLKLAQVSYDRDKRALQLGALPPLDIYRSESEVAARRVQVIQAQYALSQAEEGLRILIGADRDPTIHKLPLDLTENPEPSGRLRTVDPEQALQQALDQRPEVEAAKDALQNDADSIRLANNQLKPNLSLSGFYQSSGLGGNQYSLTTGQLIQSGGFGSSFNQVFGFGEPGYGGSLTLTLPFRNRGAKASLGSAYVSRSRDLSSAGQVREQITQQVSNAARQLEEAKMALTASMDSFDLAKKTLASEQRKYELGAETNFFVLDAQTRLAQAELVLLQTQINYRVALSDLDHATGGLLSPYRIAVEKLSK